LSIQGGAAPSLPSRNGQYLASSALAATGLAAKTVNIHLKAARMLFKAARRDSLIAEDPGEFVSTIRSRSSGVKRSFTPEQLRAVLSLANPEWRSLVVFGLFTGQRLGDLARLTWSAIDLQKNQLRLHTGKTDHYLPIPLAVPLRRDIENLERPIDPMAPVHPRAFAIVGREGRSGTLSRQFGELLAQAGLREKRSHQADPTKAGRRGARVPSRLSFHSLRRTATTLLLGSLQVEGDQGFDLPREHKPDDCRAPFSGGGVLYGSVSSARIVVRL
jgi:integrase